MIKPIRKIDVSARWREQKELFSSSGESGFTLLELMIAIVLGLIIVAAALALFLGSSRNVNFQDSADDVQEAVVFSLSYIQKEIAMANLGAHRAITHDSAWTGIVLTSSKDHPSEKLADGSKRQVGNLRGAELSEQDSKEILSQTEAEPDEINSNTNKRSDQLTIQYEAPFKLVDCQGAERQKGDMVIERFFVRPEKNIPSSEEDALNLVLACDAGSYRVDDDISENEVKLGDISIKDFNDSGEVLINRVDYFGVRVGVQNGNKLSYLPIDDYVTNPKGSIVAVQIGVIARGVKPVGSAPQTKFNVFGQSDADALIIENDQKNYVRRVYQHTIRLRNSVTDGELQ